LRAILSDLKRDTQHELNAQSAQNYP
jgi:hypothetical protein